MLKRLGLSLCVLVLSGGGLMVQAQDDRLLADYVSSDANLFVEFQLADSDVNLARVATAIARLNDPASAEQMAAALTPQMIISQSLQGFDYAWVEPWIGDSIGYVVYQTSNSVPPQLMLVAPVGDTDAYAEFWEEWSGAPDAEERDGATIAVPPFVTQLRAVLFEDVAYFGYADFADAMFAMHAGESSLGATTGYQRVQESLPDGFVELYMSGETLTLIGASSGSTPETFIDSYELLTRVTPGDASALETALIEAGAVQGIGFSVSTSDETIVFNAAATIDAEYEEPPAAARGELLPLIPDDARFILDTSQGAVADAAVAFALVSPAINTVFNNVIAGLENEPTPTPPPTPTADEMVLEAQQGLALALGEVGLTLDDLAAMRELEVTAAIYNSPSSTYVPGTPGPAFAMWLELDDMGKGLQTAGELVLLSGPSGLVIGMEETVIEDVPVQSLSLVNGYAVQYGPLTDNVLFVNLTQDAETIIGAADDETDGTVAQVQAIQEKLGNQLDLLMYLDLRVVGEINGDSRAAEWFPVLFTLDSQANGVFSLRLAMYDQE